jgi:DNA-binding MarR family transcriptional regulator
MRGEQEKLIQLLHKVNHELGERVSKVFDQYHMSPGAVSIIRYINTVPGITISAISRQLNIAKSHVSNVIVKLIQEKLVEKQSDPNDHRIYKVFLTAEGEAFLDEIKMSMRDGVQDVIDELPENRIQLLIDGLQELERALDTVKQRESEA